MPGIFDGDEVLEERVVVGVIDVTISTLLVDASVGDIDEVLEEVFKGDEIGLRFGDFKISSPQRRSFSEVSAGMSSLSSLSSSSSASSS